MRPRRAFSGLALLAAALLAAALAGPADAQRRSFCGPVSFVGRNCVTVPASTVGARDFDISGARPIPRRGATIAGTGRMQGLSPCTNANRHLVSVRWHNVAACPLAH